MKRAWQAWVALWDHWEHPRTLALVRIAVALAILWDFLTILRLGLVTELLGAAEAGGLGDPLAAKTVPFVYQVLPAVPATAWALLFAMIALCLMVAGGVFTPAAIVGLLLVYAQTEDVLPVSDRGIDRLLRNVLVVLAFSKSHHWASVDAWRRTGSWWGDGADVPAWPRHLVVLQLVAMYFGAGVSKLGMDWHPMGGFAALWIILQDATMSRVDLTPWPWLYPFTQLGSAVTMLWEWTAPVVLLFFWWRHTADRPGRLRAFANRWQLHLWWLGVGVIFHVLIAITLELGIFPYAMLGTYVAFLHPDQLARRGRALAATPG